MAKMTNKRAPKLPPVAFVKNAAMRNSSAPTSEPTLRKRIRAASKGVRALLKGHLAAVA